MIKTFFVFLLTGLSITAVAQNEDSTWLVNNYYKIERMVPMRDGVRLFTSFYIPKDSTEKHPFLMTRTPYSCAPYGENKFASFWSGYRMVYMKEHYIIVTQDVRGRYMSEGLFADVRPFNPNKKTKKDIDEASDTYDAIDWMLKNIPGNNGNVGVFGISYPGFYSTEAALSGHPALKAVSPQAPVTDWFMGDDFHHNGAFFAMDGFSFYSSFGKPRPIPVKDYGGGFVTPIKDNYKFYLTAGALKNLATMIGDTIKFWHELYQHPTYDAWWKARNARVGLYNVKPALLWVGGLFDAEDCFGAWNCYKATEKQSAGTNSKLVMGPWYHGQWTRDGSFLGNVRFGSNTAAYFQQNIELPFFNYYLKEKGTADSIAEANIFFTGENSWKKLASWPPKNVSEKLLYITTDNKLSFDKNTPETPTAKANPVYSEYTSDPAHPVPYAEGILNRRTREYMTDDQRFAAQRPDVLSFATDTLTEDLTLAGGVVADLITAISTTDADFVVKVIDVFPDNFMYDTATKGNGKEYLMGGYQMLVRGEIMRGKFRNSFETPAPFVAGKISEVKYTLPDIAHTFKTGHRLMIQVQSTWFPLADRNPQKFVNIYTANDSDFQKSVIRIYHDSINQTKFTLPVLIK